jgi:hypothetical protein
LGQIPKWSTGADCKSAGFAFVGSNPALPIYSFIKKHKRFYSSKICAKAHVFSKKTKEEDSTGKLS